MLWVQNFDPISGWRYGNNYTDTMWPDCMRSTTDGCGASQIDNHFMNKKIKVPPTGSKE